MGPIAAVKEVWSYLKWRWANEGSAACVAFDATHGTETARWTLDYEPAPVPLVAERLGRWVGDHASTTFVDLGCGKGRVCLQAARYPFREVVGVELRAGLARVAARNAAADRGPGRVARVRIVHGDAATVDLPDGPLLLWLFNPFEEDVVEAVVRRIGDRSADVLYVHPRHLLPWWRAGFRELDGGGAVAVEDDWRWLRREACSRALSPVD